MTLKPIDESDVKEEHASYIKKETSFSAHDDENDNKDNKNTNKSIWKNLFTNPDEKPDVIADSKIEWSENTTKKPNLLPCPKK